MNYVVADIHGEISKLKNLISFIIRSDNDPEFIFIGDYVDKGEDAKGTLDLLISLTEIFNCIFLMGNHEHCWINLNAGNSFIAYQEYLLKYGGIQTIKAFQADFLETKRILSDAYSVIWNNLKTFHIIDEFCISHSGISVQCYDKEPQKILQKDFLFNRYEFISHQALYLKKYKVIFGHTGFYTPYVDPYKIGIDTSACYLYEQPLTAFCIETREFLDSSANLYSLNSIRNEFCPNIVRTKPWRT